MQMASAVLSSLQKAKGEGEKLSHEVPGGNPV